MSLDNHHCSQSSMAAGEPLAGSAPQCTGWLVLEEPGPWGRDVLRDSAISPAVTEFCEILAAELGIKTIATRHATRRRQRQSASRQIWFAKSAPSGGSMFKATVHELDEILGWGVEAFNGARVPKSWTSVRGEQEFICTHSGRDECCALLGRQRADARPNSWEASHLGGHRFAATSVLLPRGHVFGRLSPDSELSPNYMRGACYLPPVEQVADVAVRQHAHLASTEVLMTNSLDSPTVGDGVERISVIHAHHGSWTVDCRPVSVERRASCRSDEATSRAWVADRVVKE